MVIPDWKVEEEGGAEDPTATISTIDIDANEDGIGQDYGHALLEGCMIACSEAEWIKIKRMLEVLPNMYTLLSVLAMDASPMADAASVSPWLKTRLDSARSIVRYVEKGE